MVSLAVTTEILNFPVNNLHSFDGTSTAEIIAGDVFFEIVEPVELEYTYRLRPAKDFGAPFVRCQGLCFRFHIFCFSERELSPQKCTASACRTKVRL